MSGHSKWANIKHKKGKADAERGKIFTKIGREIAIAVRDGGANPESNGKLRDVIAKAKANNMPNDNIKRSIAKAAGELGSVNYEEITYEGYAPGGMAVIVKTVTDNRNRTASDVRHAFTKFGGNLGTSGSVSYLFTKKGVITFAPDEDGKMPLDEDKAMEIGLDAGADDIVSNDDGSIDVYTTPEAFADVVEAFDKKGIKPVSAEITMVPSTEVKLDKDAAVKFMHMIDALEDLDDTQQVYHNAELPEDFEPAE